MPIYEYRCAACGFQNEYLQKVSEPPRTTCPECGKGTFRKLVTAAGFQLKGSGWYATDFKGGGTKPAETKKDDAAKTDGATKPDTGGATKSDDKGDTKTPAAASGAGASPASS